MPTPLVWSLVGTPGSPAPVTFVGTGGAPVLPPPFDAFTQADFLDLFERLLPPHYLQPLKDWGPGYEILQAAALVGARASLATQRLATGGYALSSTGGAQAVGSVELYRGQASSDPALTVIVKAGTVVASSGTGRRFQTLTNVTFGPSDLGPFTVQVEAMRDGYEFNATGITLGADGTAMEGEIDTIAVLVEDPDLGDTTIQVRHPVACTGGADAVLDQHGADRLIFRGDNESDTQYRGRIRALPDNISPDAVERALQQLLFPFGQAYVLTETWDVGYQTCWDAPPDPIAGSSYNPNLFVYDDPRAWPFIRNRWMDESEYRGCFIVSVPRFGPVSDVGMAYDDTAANALALTYTLGSRAVGAYDVPSTLAFGYLQGCYDGYDVPRAVAMLTLWNTLQSIKAAGVVAVLELEGA